MCCSEYLVVLMEEHLTIFALKLPFLLLRLAIHSRVFLHQPISPVVLTSLHNVEVCAFCTYLLNLMFFESSQFVVYNLTQVWTFCLRPAFATRTSLITTREVISFQRRASEDSGGGECPDHLFPLDFWKSLSVCGQARLLLGRLEVISSGGPAAAEEK